VRREDYRGARYITGTGATTDGPFIAIQAVAAATLAAGTTSEDVVGAALTGLVIPAGFTIYGTFNQVQLSGGSVIAYRM
jgi:hypothetical protein